jgi:hypothetical protein
MDISSIIFTKMNKRYVLNVFFLLYRFICLLETENSIDSEGLDFVLRSDQ